MIDVSPASAEPAWAAFVERHPNATGYHQWGWRRVFERVFGHECLYLSATEGGTVTGILPIVVFRSPIFGRFGVSLPFVNYGGVVADSNAIARQLLDAGAQEAAARGLKHLELRHLAPHYAGVLPAKQHKVAMTLPLPENADALWNALDRKVRNQVRKAEKSNLTAAHGGRELVPEFYAVFARNMRDLGTPVYSQRFFATILAEFPSTAEIVVVRLGTTPIAASLTFRWRSVTEVPWASSLREHRTLSPNMLLYWTMLKRTIEAGSTVFDFGRSTPNESTYHFKTQWGATPTPFNWEYWLASGGALPDQSPSNPKFQAAIEIWKRLPVPVTTLLGPHIIRSIP
jgi:FemAB-related protein (PEP-CTERM system-associated)